jgi:tetratricopeptide (TPR) repeat protein
LYKADASHAFFFHGLGSKSGKLHKGNCHCIRNELIREFERNVSSGDYVAIAMTDLNSTLPVIYLCLFLLLLASAAWFILRQVLKTRSIESKLSALQNKLNQEKGTAQEYYELGSIYLSKKLFSQAIVQFQQALKQPNLTEQDAAPIYNALGYAYFAQDQYDLAIRQYKEALKLTANYVTALNNLGHAYERKQLIAPALESYEQALKLEPNNTTAKRRVESLRKRIVAPSQG